MKINEKVKNVKAFAPATCANVAVGFDILGFALAQVGDTVSLTRRHDNKIVIESLSTNAILPEDPDKNTATVAIKSLCEDLKLDIGFSLRIEKGIPLCSGMGGSAASAVAAVVACNAFLNSPLSNESLANYALQGEAVASGQAHADNIAPCLWGGLTLIQSLDPIAVLQLPIPEVFYVLVHPHLQIATKQARQVLQPHVPLKAFVKQSANLASFIAALYEQNLSLLNNVFLDTLIEPQRAQFVPGFDHMQSAAMQAGALGMSFSGSGPSVFAWTKSKTTAELVARAIRDELNKQTIESDYWIGQISATGAHVIEVN